MLDRIRLGSPNEGDIIALKSRLIGEDQTSVTIEQAVQFHTETFGAVNDCVCLLPTHEKVDRFNDCMLSMLKAKGVEIVEIEAIDRDINNKMKVSKRPKKVRAEEWKKKSSETAGLDALLKIGVGARVMLRRNLNVEKGFVNGSLGTVKKILFNELRQPYEIEVVFDHDAQAQRIAKIKVDFELSSKVFIERQQFPLCLAYAITIHKSQGLTLNNVMADVGSAIFEDGMIYVALSRAKKLSSIFLIDFDVASIGCKQIAAEEYNRLREQYNILHPNEKLDKLPRYNNLPQPYATERACRKRKVVLRLETSKEAGN